MSTTSEGNFRRLNGPESAPRDASILIGAVGTDKLMHAFWDSDEELWVITEIEDVLDPDRGNWVRFVWYDHVDNEDLTGWLPIPKDGIGEAEIHWGWRPLYDGKDDWEPAPDTAAQGGLPS